MTLEERAEKIADLAEHVLFSDIPDDSFVGQAVEGRGLLRKTIAAEIASAVAEAVADKESAIRAAVEEARGKELMTHCYCMGGGAHWLYICDGCKGSRINLTDPDEIKAEAYKEALDDLTKDFIAKEEVLQKRLEEGLAKARARAYEDAAKIVETEHTVCLPLMCETARKIRARAAEVGK